MLRPALLALLCAHLFCSPVGAADVQAIPGMESVTHFTLDNGMQVVLGKPLREPLFSEILLVVRAGIGTAAGQEEVAGVAAQAFLAGGLSTAAPPVRLELARLGVLPDFTVGREIAVFRLTVPTRNAAAFLQFLAALIDREPDKSAWREAVVAKLQQLDEQGADPWQRALRELQDLLWKGAEPAPVGARRDLPSTATADFAAFIAFWRRAYSPGNMVLSVWGEQREALAQTIRDEFSRIRRAAAAAAPAIAEPVRNRGASLRCIRDERANPAALLVGVGIDTTSEDDYYAWQLVAHILGASHNSRLQTRLRSDAQLVYSVEAAGVPVGEHGITLRVVTQTESLERVRQVILQEIVQLTREPVGSRELVYAQALLRSRLRLDSASLREQFYRVSLALLGQKHVRDPREAQPSIDAMTPARLLDIVRRTLDPDEISSVIVSSDPNSLCEAHHEGVP